MSCAEIGIRRMDMDYVKKLSIKAVIDRQSICWIHRTSDGHLLVELSQIPFSEGIELMSGIVMDVGIGTFLAPVVEGLRVMMTSSCVTITHLFATSQPSQQHG